LDGRAALITVKGWRHRIGSARWCLDRDRPLSVGQGDLPPAWPSGVRRQRDGLPSPGLEV